MDRAPAQTTPPERGPVVLVTSPHAGHALGGEHLTRKLAAVGVAVARHVPVSELYEHRPEGERWRTAGYSAAIAAGGDGTVGTVASHLIGSGLPLGILPLGTANDVARSLAIPLDLDHACQIIAEGTTLEVDAGQVVPALTKPGALAVPQTAVEHAIEPPLESPSSDDAPSPRSGAYFLHALTLGLNVEFARLATNVSRRQRLRALTYPASAVEAVARYRPIRAKLRFHAVDGVEGAPEQVLEAAVLTVLAVNTPVFGGPMNLWVPEVSVRDRLLDFVVIEAPEVSRLSEAVEGLRARLGEIIANLLPRDEDTPDRPHANGEHDEPHDEERVALLPRIHHYRARSLILETAEPADLAMDGEIRAHTPVLVRVAAEPVRVYVPSETTRDQQGIAREQHTSGTENR
jgi:diacylglycerol kinase family enzyme